MNFKGLLVRFSEEKTATFWIILFFSVFLLWIGIAWFTLPGQHIRVLDILDFFTAFNGDDGYRYFFYRQAFTNPELYTWDYVLPVPMLLDGTLLALFNADVFCVRVAHAVFAFFSLYLLFRTQRIFGVSRNLAASSVLLLALMPVYALHAMSFYGESWLIFFVILVWYFFSSKKYLGAAFAASLLPLIRPEGFLLILPLFAYFLGKRMFREFFLLGFAGGVYFFWLLYSLSLHDFFLYFTWHEEYREYINHIQFPVLNNRWGFFYSYNALWYGIAFSALLFCVNWKTKAWLGWLVSGNLLFIGAYFALLWSGNLYYEPRYFMFTFPMMTILFSIGIKSISEKEVFKKRRVASGLGFSFVMIFIITNHLLQNDELRNKYFAGKRLPFYKEQGPVYGLENDHREIEKINELLDVLYRVVERYPQIETVFMPAFRDVYYVLDPARLKGVEFVMLPLSYGRHVSIFGGSLFGWHAGGDQYSYYNFYSQERSSGKQVGLYFGDMKGCASCTTIAYKEDKGVYVVYYEQRSEPMRKPNDDEVFIISPAEN